MKTSCEEKKRRGAVAVRHSASRHPVGGMSRSTVPLTTDAFLGRPAQGNALRILLLQESKMVPLRPLVWPPGRFTQIVPTAHAPEPSTPIGDWGPIASRVRPGGSIAAHAGGRPPLYRRVAHAMRS